MNIKNITSEKLSKAERKAQRIANRLVSDNVVVAQNVEPTKDVETADPSTETETETADETAEADELEPREYTSELTPVLDEDGNAIPGLFSRGVKQQLKERIGRAKKGQPKREPRIVDGTFTLLAVANTDAVVPALLKFYQNNSAEVVATVNTLLDELVVKATKDKVFNVKKALDNIRALMIRSGYSADEIRAALVEGGLLDSGE